MLSENPAPCCVRRGEIQHSPQQGLAKGTSSGQTHPKQSMVSLEETTGQAEHLASPERVRRWCGVPVRTGSTILQLTQLSATLAWQSWETLVPAVVATCKMKVLTFT